MIRSVYRAFAACAVVAIVALFPLASGAPPFKQGGGAGPAPPLTLLPSDRDASTNWKMAGLLSIGGITTRTTQCGSTINPIGGGTDDTSNIQSAINACPSGQYVLLGSGTFTIAIGSTININKSVTLRGQGPSTTILQHPTGPGTWATNNATFQASVSGSVMTVLASPAPFGQIVCGGSNPSIIAGGGGIGGPPAGIPSGTTCASYGTGNVNLAPGTYNLSTSPGTVASEAMSSTQCNSAGAWGATLGCGISGSNPSPVVKLGSGPPSAAATSALAVDGTKGSTTIQVASTTGFAVGGLAHIDELGNGQAENDPAFNSATGTVWASTDWSYVWNVHVPAVNFYDSSCLDSGSEGSTNCGPNNFAGAPPGGDECAYSIRCGGVREEDHLITAIGAGPCPGTACTLTFDSPLMVPYHTANSAQAVSWSSSSLTSKASLENLTVKNGDNNNVITQGCVYCWSYNVEQTNWLGHGFSFDQAAFRPQLDTFWSHNAAWPSPGGGGYSIALTYGVTECLITNGISMLANKVMVVRASGAGCVVSYNYMDDGYIFYSLAFPEVGINESHLIGSHHVLFEGNATFNADNDSTHGNSTYPTYFRNFATGYRAAFTAITGATVDDANNIPGPTNAVIRCFGWNMYTGWVSYIGNVCGIPGAESGWTYSANTGSTPRVYSPGWNPTSVSGGGPDTAVATIYPSAPTGVNATACNVNPDPCTAIVTGNYEYVSSPSGAITWDMRGPAPLPSSLYLPSAPSFFTSTSCTWPWVNSVAGAVYTLPAKARFLAGTPFTPVNCSASPTASLAASPASIPLGNSSTLSWSSTNASSCTSSDIPSFPGATSGSISVSPTTTTTYHLSCSTASASTTVTVVTPSSSTVWSSTACDTTDLNGCGTATVSCKNGGQQSPAIGSQAVSSGFPYYFEAVIHSPSQVGAAALGLANSSVSHASGYGLGSDTNSYGWLGNGGGQYNGSSPVGIGAYSSDDRLAIFFNATQIWVEDITAHPGVWNNNSANVPGTSGGQNLNNVASTAMTPATSICLFDAAATATIYPSPSQWTGTVPSGANHLP